MPSPDQNYREQEIPAMFAEFNAQQKARLQSLMTASTEEAENKIPSFGDLAEEKPSLTYDEECMITAYRNFVARSKPGAVFKWKTSEDRTQIVTPPKPSILVHPSEVE